MTTRGAYHHPGCEAAKQPACECGSCGGSLHGWVGWTELARPDNEPGRSDLRRELNARWQRTVRRRSLTRCSLGADLARLDIVDWMAAEDRDFAQGRADLPHDPGASRASPDPQMRERVVLLAGRIGKPVFDRVVEELQAAEIGHGRLRDIRKAMANHYWCALFVALARALDAYNDAWEQVATFAKREVTRDLRELLGSRGVEPIAPVVDLLVDKSCEALRDLAGGHVPLLTVVDSTECVRALRILAIFCCPAPQRHPDLAKECLGPLAGEAGVVLREETRARLESAFGFEGGSGR